MKDEAIFHLFASRADVNGVCISVGVEDSIVLKHKAVFRGMSAKSGKPKKNLTWLETIVALLREATTGEHFNHEWWAGEISKPEWVRRFDEHYGESWLYFPSSPEELNPHALGSKVGDVLTFHERRLNSSLSDADFLRKWEAAEVRKGMRGTEPEFEKKTRVVFIGFDSWQQYATEAAGNARTLRGTVISIAAQNATADEFLQFMRGFNAGLKRALDDFASDPLSEFNELREVAEIMTDHWQSIAEMRNRGEVIEFVLRHMSPSRRKFLKDDFQSRRFTARLRNICRRIDLKLGGVGRPRKIGEMSEGE